MGSRLRILVLCTGNCIRSQMAEAWFNHLADDHIQAVSAGTHPSGYVHPFAIEAMAEVGIDMEGAESKSLHLFLEDNFDYVITVCDDAAKLCPSFPGQATRLHWPLEDPTRTLGDEQVRLAAFRAARDQLRGKIETFLIETSFQDKEKGP